MTSLEHFLHKIKWYGFTLILKTKDFMRTVTCVVGIKSLQCHNVDVPVIFKKKIIFKYVSRIIQEFFMLLGLFYKQYVLIIFVNSLSKYLVSKFFFFFHFRNYHLKRFILRFDILDSWTANWQSNVRGKSLTTVCNNVY